MSEPQMLPSRGPSMPDPVSESTPDPQSEGAPDPSQFDAIVQAAFGDTARSSGSLESNTSASSSPSADRSSTGSSSTSQSVPSLTTTSTSTSTTASAASSKTPSPCPSILRSNSAPPSAFPTLSSTSSSAGSSPNVTFAPLPQTEPRKRNSSHPLGVAARSRLLRHRRMLRERGLNPDDYPYHYQQQQQQQYQYQQQYQQQYQYGYGSGVESGDPHPYVEDGAAVEFPEIQGEDGQEEHVRVRRSRTMSDTGREGEEEDPFVALGKLVKGAGKTLWKSLSMRDMRAKEREGAKAKDKDKDKGGKGAGAEKQPRTSEGGGSVQEKEAVPRRSIVGTGHLFDDDSGAAPPRTSEEGGVWEEEVTEDSWKKLLSKPEPTPDTANGDASDDGQATPTLASVEAVDGTTVLTTIIVAQPSTKAR